jgi:four helix bundle protein
LKIENVEHGKGAQLRERAFTFALAVVELHRNIYRREPELREVSRQAMRAAGSIGANLEEADAAQSRADFISKCNIESRYWLRILTQTLKFDSPLIAESTELIAILTTIVRKTKDRT